VIGGFERPVKHPPHHSTFSEEDLPAMRKLLLTPVLVLCVAFSSRAADDKKKDDAKKAEEEKFVSLGHLDGILKKSGGSGAGITVSVELILPDPNAQIAQLQQQIALAQAMTIRNPLQRQQQLVSIMQQMRNGQNAFIRKTVDVDVEPLDDMIVRTMFLPEQFDDKGKPRKYTSKELKELRGPDSTLPGYTADNDSLKNGDLVTVYLVRKKHAPEIKAAPKDKEKKDKDKDKEKKDKDNEKLWDEENKPKVRMIVLRAEPRQ